jgi:hypothetical protein
VLIAFLFKMNNEINETKATKAVGGFIAVLYFTIPQFSALAYVISVLTLYTVNIDYINKHLSWLSIPIMFVLVLISVIIWLVVNYRFLYPMFLAFQNKQIYKHGNPITDDLKAIKKALKIHEIVELKEDDNNYE